MVGEWTPPSRCASPSITTGAKNPGMAHDAATASATRGRRSPRPNTTRRPSDCRTAQIHSGSGGQASGQQRADPLRDHLRAHRALRAAARRPAPSAGRSTAGGRPGRGSPPGRRPRRGWRDGRSGGGPGIGPSPRDDPLALGRQRSVLGPRQQVGRREPGPQRRPGDRPGRRPDDDRRLPRVPAGARRPAPPAPRRGTRRRRPRRRRAPTRRARRSRRADRTASRLRPPGGR